VRYVEPLIGPYTVNTMPDETINAFADHGVVEADTVDADLEEAQQVFSDLQKGGMDFDGVAWQLENEGAQKFIDPFDQLMKTLADKRQKFLGARASRQAMALGQLKPLVTSAFRALDSRQFGRRLFAPDPFLWTNDAQQAEAIRQQLGWLHSIEAFRGKAMAITEFAIEIKEARFSHVVLLATGGLGLFAEVCRDTFGVAPGWPQLLVLDNIDPATIHEVEACVDRTKTLFIVASKAETTAEFLTLFRYVHDRLKPQMAGKAGNHLVTITDLGTPLAAEVRRQGFRYRFENPADIGGRHSALSYFGLVPMALLGIDITSSRTKSRFVRMCGRNSAGVYTTFLAIYARRETMWRCARKSKRSRLSSISPTIFFTTVRHRHRRSRPRVIQALPSSLEAPSPDCGIGSLRS